MLDKIAPGSKVNVKVVKMPTNQAARKTIVRLLSKDASVKRDNKRLARTRRDSFRQAQRGGRFWNINVVKQAAVKADPGVVKTIIATLDVLTDLKSVAKFVEVTAV
jgi:hypothetical protein